MQIHISRDGQQFGPYSEEEIKQHIEAGKFSQDDLAWTEGQADWTPLSNVLHTTPIPPPPPQKQAFSTNEPSSAKPSESSTKTFSESIVEKATFAARLTQKQAHKKKLEMVDLKQADYQIGKKAYESNIAPEHYPEIRSQIAEARQQIEAHRNAPEAATVSLTDKAKAAANAAGRTAKVEALTMKQKGLLTDLGTKLRENSTDDPALAAEIANARKTAETIHNLDSEIQSLSSKTFTWARRPLLIVSILIGLVVASIAYGWGKGIYQRWSIQRQTQHIQQQAQAQTAQIAAEMAELQRKDAEDRKKEKKDREVRLAQERLDQQKRELERQQEARARQTQTETEQRQREAEREEQQRQKIQTDAERAQKDEVAKKQEQEQRAAFAADRFSRLSVSPRAALSATLKRLGVSVELRGKDTDTLQSLLQQRDYLKLISYLRDRPYTEYPPVGEIENAIRTLARKDFSILLKTTLSESRDNELYLISFPDNDYRIVESSSSWERHPDGIGYLHKWSLSDGPVILLTGNYKTVQDPIHSFNDSARKQCEALKQKKELGEIDEGAYQARVAEVRKATYDGILQWALSR